MTTLDITSATASDMYNAIEDIVPYTATIDGIGNQPETTWINPNFSQYFGMYKTIPEVKIVIDTMAMWTIGDGYKADPYTSVILDHISGWGIETFDEILDNLLRTMSINGDSFAEIIREDNIIINLKPLDPSTVKIVVDDLGIIKHYEQISKIKGKASKIFKTEDILHFCNRKVADEIHGISDVEAMVDIINANKESFNIQKQIVKNFARPKLMVAMDTDDTIKIDEFVTKFDAATAKGENLFFPKGTVEPTVLAVPANATLNVMPWREHLKNYFYQVVGIPQILMGSSGEFTESTAKIAYLAFERNIKERQRRIITQVWGKMNLRIDLDVPVSLKNELLSDESKDAEQGMELQPGDTTAGIAR